MIGIISSEFLIRNTLTLSSSIISNITYLRSYKLRDEELDKIFIERDILSDIGIIKSYIDEHSHNKDNQSPTFKASIQNLNETLCYLEEEISKLTRKIKDHNLKWFSYYRSYDIATEKKKIFILIDQMNHRFDMLLKVKVGA
jgi:hypothetical protein